jgi:hypothetical protein
MKGKFGKKEKALMWALAIAFDFKRANAADLWECGESSVEGDDGLCRREVWIVADTFRLRLGWCWQRDMWHCEYEVANNDKYERAYELRSYEPRLRDALEGLARTVYNWGLK